MVAELGGRLEESSDKNCFEKERERTSVWEVARGHLGRASRTGSWTWQEAEVRCVGMGGATYWLDVCLRTKSVSFTVVQSWPQRTCSTDNMLSLIHI